MIFIFVGESASGKTTLMNIVSDVMNLEKNVAYTTRPLRVGELYGVDYYFMNEQDLESMGDDLICKREYFPATDEKWTYALRASSFDSNKDYAVILDPLGAQQLKERFPDSKIIYIKVPENIRRERAYGRENKTLDPEIERRFRADAIDFEGFTYIADFNVLNINIQSAARRIGTYIVECLMGKRFWEYGQK